METNTKICTKCKENKEFVEFNKAKFGAFGLRSICRSCQAKEASLRYDKKKDEICAYGKEYREKNKEEISKKRAVHTAKNKERLAAYGSQWQKDNPGKVNAKTARRRAARLRAVPKWLDKDHYKQMENKYIEAITLTKETGIPHEVDHIIPLQGREVSGLHVPWNLRVISMTENRQKSRKIISL